MTRMKLLLAEMTPSERAGRDCPSSLCPEGFVFFARRHELLSGGRLAGLASIVEDADGSGGRGISAR